MIGLAAAAAGAVATIVATSPGGGGAPVPTSDKAAIVKIVREYILANPEIVTEAMDRLEERAMAKAIEANRKLIETPFAGAWEGNPDADVTLVEFFDYSCGYCRASLPVIDRLLKEDPKLRVVYRELPVLGPDSEAAAHLSIAAAQRGNYGAFHRALYATGRPDAAARQQLAQQFGVSPAPTEASRSEIGTNMQLQSALRISGTPTWIVGDRLLGGAVGYEALKEAIAEARARK